MLVIDIPARDYALPCDCKKLDTAARTGYATGGGVPETRRPFSENSLTARLPGAVGGCHGIQDRI